MSNSQLQQDLEDDVLADLLETDSDDNDNNMVDSDELDDEPEEEVDETEGKIESKKRKNVNEFLMTNQKVAKAKKKRKQLAKFIDDEAELSSEDEGKVSSDENDDSDDDNGEIEDLVDKEAPELDSDQEEEVRGLYHKQLAQENQRDVMIMQEHLEENAITYGMGRRKRFRWQAREMMENSLKRHYDPDDEEDEDDDDDDEEDMKYGEGVRPKLRRPDAEALLMKSTRLMSERVAIKHSDPNLVMMNEDSNSNSNLMNKRPSVCTSRAASGIKGFIFNDKATVQALSIVKPVTKTREENEKLIQREFNRVLNTKSVFDMFS